MTIGLATAILSILAVLLPLLVAGAVKRQIASRKAERDAALLAPDPTELSLELDRLYQSAGGAPRLARPEAGDQLQPDDRRPG